MTMTVTEITLGALSGANYETLSTTYGVVAIVLLLGLLALKEVARSRPGLRHPASLQVFDIAAVPLLLMFGWVIVLRLLDLVRL